MTQFRSFAVAATIGFASVAASASAVMPNFADVPTGWTTDRYDPASFTNVGTYQGRSDVLGISISSADSLTNRPGAYQSSFYNTQGRQHAVTGGAGSSLSADLYVDAAWRDAANGNVRTDMWGVMTDGAAVTDYPIIGFTNYGGAARYRVWDDSGWHDLATTVAFGAWTSFEILFTGASYDYFIDGNQVYTDAAIDGSTGFSAVIMQAYNFGDPAGVPNAVATDYSVHWSNAQVVPEPSSIALVALALVGGAVVRRRQA